ncbi:unnamed protein product [Caenorhabditis auriculariae]|uniref:Uncharacterized protein n=1 Tax=Caenorhabditis auriculariae TaxID=2777116 RepID=A0A8S1HJU6_9PELO|nr:unnamed protein product [Caenorhabditis auriculariae]
MLLVLFLVASPFAVQSQICDGCSLLQKYTTPQLYPAYEGVQPTMQQYGTELGRAIAYRIHAMYGDMFPRPGIPQNWMNYRPPPPRPAAPTYANEVPPPPPPALPNYGPLDSPHPPMDLPSVRESILQQQPSYPPPMMSPSPMVPQMDGYPGLIPTSLYSASYRVPNRYILRPTLACPYCT